MLAMIFNNISTLQQRCTKLQVVAKVLKADNFASEYIPRLVRIHYMFVAQSKAREIRETHPKHIPSLS